MVAQFYRGVFEQRGHKIEVMEDSSRGAILEAEDSHVRLSKTLPL